MTSVTTFCGSCAVLGRPNVGKSTLINAILGQPVSITSRRPQTTRGRILGVHTRQAFQIIFVDTPGFQLDPKRAMDRFMNQTVQRATLDASMVLLVSEGTRWTETESELLTKLRTLNLPVILVINKIDRLPAYEQLLPYLKQQERRYPFHAMIPVSAIRKENIEPLIDEIKGLLPMGKHEFDAQVIIPAPKAAWCAELIREKLMRFLGSELPYVAAVEVERFHASSTLTEIIALIWVEKESQKAIVIGSHGQQLKKIGQAARVAIEQALKTKVFLSLWVKVKRDWTQTEERFKRFIAH